MAAKRKTVKSPPEGALLAMLDALKETDGGEIPREQWPIAEILVARGLITLGAARGPGNYWRRAELVVEVFNSANQRFEDRTTGRPTRTLDADGNCVCPEAPGPHAQHAPAGSTPARRAFPEGEDGPRMAGGGGTPSQVGQHTPSDHRPELKRCCRACCPIKLWGKLVDRPDSKPCDRCGNTTTYLGEIAFVASLPLKACGPCKTWKDCARDNFCFRRENAERAAHSLPLDAVPADTVAAAEPGHPMNPLLKLSLDLSVQQYLQAHPGKTAETTTVHELLTWWGAL